MIILTIMTFLAGGMSCRFGILENPRYGTKPTIAKVVTAAQTGIILNHLRPIATLHNLWNVVVMLNGSVHLSDSVEQKPTGSTIANRLLLQRLVPISNSLTWRVSTSPSISQLHKSKFTNVPTLGLAISGGGYASVRTVTLLTNS